MAKRTRERAVKERRELKLDKKRAAAESRGVEGDADAPAEPAEPVDPEPAS